LCGLNVVSAAERSHKAAEALRALNRKKGDGHPTTCEMIYSADEVEFMNAIQAWKVKMSRQFPTWREVLGVLRELGYEKGPNRAA
jgi:hypothetical protein